MGLRVTARRSVSLVLPTIALASHRCRRDGSFQLSCRRFVLPVPSNYDADELDGKEASGPDSFYKVYEPVFERNKRFAAILPAPSLGDDDTPIGEVRVQRTPRVKPITFRQGLVPLSRKFSSFQESIFKFRWRPSSELTYSTGPKNLRLSCGQNDLRPLVLPFDLWRSSATSSGTSGSS